jgi:hypothetical protein
MGLCSITALTEVKTYHNLEYIMEEKENLNGLLSKTYELRDGLKKDYRFALLMEIISILSLILGIIKLNSDEWVLPFVLVLLGFSLFFGYMVVKGFRLLRKTMAVISALEYKIKSEEK